MYCCWGQCCGVPHNADTCIPSNASVYVARLLHSQCSAQLQSLALHQWEATRGSWLPVLEQLSLATVAILGGDWARSKTSLSLFLSIEMCLSNTNKLIYVSIILNFTFCY